jgi:hypothetical protein
MMSMRWTVGIVLAMAGGLAAGQPEPPQVEQFKYQAVIRGGVQKNTVGRIDLPLEILNRSEADLADLRLFDRAGVELPYVVRLSRLRPEAEGIQLEITGYREIRGGVELVVRVPDETPPLNGLEFIVPETDFRKQVTVIAETPGGPEIGRDTIYDFSSYVALRRIRVEIPATEARTLVLRIIDSEPAPADRDTLQLSASGLEIVFSRSWAKRLRIDGVRGRSERAEPGGLRTIRWIEQPVPALQDGRTTVIDVPVRLPAGRIRFDVTTPIFYRPVSLAGSATGGKDTYQPIGSGAICSFPLGGRAENRITLDIAGKGIAFYRITIENGDSPPLEFQSLTFESPARQLYFLATSARLPLRLVVGAPAVQPPQYDLNRFGGSDAWAEHTGNRLELDPVVPNPDYNPEAGGTGRERAERTILTAVILALVAGLGFWLFVLLRKGAAGPPTGDTPRR